MSKDGEGVVVPAGVDKLEQVNKEEEEKGNEKEGEEEEVEEDDESSGSSASSSEDDTVLSPLEKARVRIQVSSWCVCCLGFNSSCIVCGALETSPAP